MKETCARADQEDLQLRERSHIGKVHWELYLVTVSSGRKPMQEQRKNVRIPPPEEEVTEGACEEPTPSPSIACPLMLLEGRSREN